MLYDQHGLSSHRSRRINIFKVTKLVLQHDNYGAYKNIGVNVGEVNVFAIFVVFFVGLLILCDDPINEVCFILGLQDWQERMKSTGGNLTDFPLLISKLLPQMKDDCQNGF